MVALKKFSAFWKYLGYLGLVCCHCGHLRATFGHFETFLSDHKGSGDQLAIARWVQGGCKEGAGRVQGGCEEGAGGFGGANRQGDLPWGQNLTFKHLSKNNLQRVIF